MPATDKKDFLYLIWKDPTTRQNFIVGKLSHEKDYEFWYCEESELAMKNGWGGLEPFPDKEKVYKSEVMFPVFSSRLPDPKRRDIKNILDKYGLSSYDPYELLKKNSGKLPIDTYEFVWPIFPDDETVQRDFYVMGVRHVAKSEGKQCACLPLVEYGDNLFFLPEPDNEKDHNAILVITENGEKIGYVPRYYNEPILKRLSSGSTYSCKVLEVNPAPNCSECLKVRLNIPCVDD